MLKRKEKKKSQIGQFRSPRQRSNIKEHSNGSFLYRTNNSQISNINRNRSKSCILPATFFGFSPSWRRIMFFPISQYFLEKLMIPI